MVLREVAPRLKRFARPEDRVAHLGGDEYLLLLGADPSAEDAAIFAERLQRSIGEPCRMNGREATVSGSIGIALLSRHGGDLGADRPCRCGDAGGQARRRPGLRVLRAAHDDDARDQLDLLRDLRRAVEDKPARAFYQPKIDAPSGQVTAAEALLRWHHPTRGMVGPDRVHPDRRALRPDQRARQLGHRGRLPPGARVARAGPEDARRDQPVGVPDAPGRPGRAHPGGAEAPRHRPVAADLRDHRVGGDGGRARDATSSGSAQAGVHLSIDDFGTGYRASPICASCRPPS